MAKDYASSFYKSAAWENCRAAFIVAKFGICERCGKAGSIVHHKTYITPENINDPSITLDWDNLELLCQDCHNKEHLGNHEEVLAEGLTFDETGQLVAARPEAPHQSRNKKR